MLIGGHRVGTVIKQDQDRGGVTASCRKPKGGAAVGARSAGVGTELNQGKAGHGDIDIGRGTGGRVKRLVAVGIGKVEAGSGGDQHAATCDVTMASGEMEGGETQRPAGVGIGTKGGEAATGVGEATHGREVHGTQAVRIADLGVDALGKQGFDPSDIARNNGRQQHSAVVYEGRRLGDDLAHPVAAGGDEQPDEVGVTS